MSGLWLGSFLALLAGVLTIAGNVYAKEWATRPGIVLFTLTVLFYLSGSVVFPFSLRFGPLAILSTLASLTTIMVTLLIGIFYYREQLTPTQIAGLVLAVFTVVLLVWPR